MRHTTKLTTAIILLSLCFITASRAATLHSVLVIDTNDWAIGVSTKQDMHHYQQFLQRAASHTGMEISETLFAGDDFISDDVYEHVKNLQVAPEDTVVFYYSGHGYRTESKATVWPVMSFGFDQLGLDTHDVATMLEAKGPRMLIVMSDTCNGIENDEFVPEWDHTQALQGISRSKLHNAYRALFLDKDLMIMTTSSEPGQYSYGPASGGVYTNAFLRSFYHEVKHRSPSWVRLLDRAQKKVDRVEHPLYEIKELNQSN